MFLQSTPAPVPFIITLLSVLGTVLIIVLVQVAGKIYRSADKILFVTMWKMALFDKEKYKLRLKVENMTGKVTHMRDISIIYLDHRKICVYSKLDAMPIQSEGDFDFVRDDGQGGYMLRIFPHAKHNVVLDFSKNHNIKLEEGTQLYLCYTNNRGKKRIAKINLGTDRVQVLQFKNHR